MADLKSGAVEFRSHSRLEGRVSELHLRLPLYLVFPPPKLHAVRIIQDMPVLRIAMERAAGAVGNVAKVTQQGALMSLGDLGVERFADALVRVPVRSSG